MNILKQPLKLAMTSALALGLGGPAFAQNPCGARKSPCAPKSANPCAARKKNPWRREEGKPVRREESLCCENNVTPKLNRDE